MYKHNKYEDLNPEEEINRLKRVIKEWGKYNSAKIYILAAVHQKEQEEIKQKKFILEKKQIITFNCEHCDKSHKLLNEIREENSLQKQTITYQKNLIDESFVYKNGLAKEKAKIKELITDNNEIRVKLNEIRDYAYKIDCYWEQIIIKFYLVANTLAEKEKLVFKLKQQIQELKTIKNCTRKTLMKTKYIVTFEERNDFIQVFFPLIENFYPYKFICTWSIFINKNPHNNKS